VADVTEAVRPPAPPRPVSIKRNIAANYAGQMVASVLGLALVPAYIRYLGMEAYALVGLFAVIQAWLALLDLGMTPTLSREMARFSAGNVPVQAIRDLLRSLEMIYIGLAVVVALALTVGARFIASHWLNLDALPVETVAGALSLLGLVVSLRFCEGIYRSGITGLQQQVWLNGLIIGSSIVRSIGALAVLAFVSPTIQAFFVWQGLVSLVSLSLLAMRLHRELPSAPERPRFSLAALKAVRGFAGGVFGVTICAMMLAQSDKLILSRLISLTDLGHYMLASTIATGLFLVGGPIVIAVGPALVRMTEAHDRELLAITYHKAAQLVAVALAPPALLMMVFPFGLLFAWTGDADLAQRTAPILALLAAGTLCNALYQVPYQLQVAAGWTAMTLGLFAAALALLVTAMLVVVPIGGATAAGGVWAVTNLLLLTIGMALVHRRLLPGELRHWLLSDTLAPLAGAAAVMLVAWLAQPAPDASRLVWTGFVTVTGVATLLGAASMSASLRQRLRQRLQQG
jgi:O-antigen/teichoic acid export membrane protein